MGDDLLVLHLLSTPQSLAVSFYPCSSEVTGALRIFPYLQWQHLTLFENNVTTSLR
jgi:hypothetical protein